MRDVGLGAETRQGDDNEELPKPMTVDTVAAIFSYLLLLMLELEESD